MDINLIGMVFALILAVGAGVSGTVAVAYFQEKGKKRWLEKIHRRDWEAKTDKLITDTNQELSKIRSIVIDFDGRFKEQRSLIDRAQDKIFDLKKLVTRMTEGENLAAMPKNTGEEWCVNNRAPVGKLYFAKGRFTLMTATEIRNYKDGHFASIEETASYTDKRDGELVQKLFIVEVAQRLVR